MGLIRMTLLRDMNYIFFVLWRAVVADDSKTCTGDGTPVTGLISSSFESYGKEF